MADTTPVAFLSYAHRDDDNDGNRISHLREALEKAVEIQAGQPFPIFQDRTGIRWGAAWKEQVDDAIDGSTFLLSVITPSFFRSEECVREVERFLVREEKLGRTDLVLPIYYLRAREMEGQVPSELGARLRARQWVDWRQVRLHPVGADVVRRAIAELADRLTDALWRTDPSPRPSIDDRVATPTPVPPGPRPAAAAEQMLAEARAEADRITAEARRRAHLLRRAPSTGDGTTARSVPTDSPLEPPDFTVVKDSGYDIDQVGAYLDAVQAARSRGDADPLPRGVRVVRRGYWTAEVDAYLRTIGAGALVPMWSRPPKL